MKQRVIFRFAAVVSAVLALCFSGCRPNGEAQRLAAERRADSLNEILMRRDAEIAVLRTRVGDLQAAVDAASADTLVADTVAEVADANAIATVVVRPENPELLLLGTAYYILGSKAELMRKGVLKRTFPLFGKLYINSSRRLDADFHRVDTGRNVTFAVNHIGARLVSQHPEGSYEVNSSKGGKFWREIHITNPDAFWSQSKVLVVAYD